MTTTLKLVKQVINPGDRILILDCVLVQLSIVNENFERTIILLNKYPGTPHGEILGLMKPLTKGISSDFQFIKLYLSKEE